ncbi:MAG: hypothetical protein HZB46_01665 [Solirubrobacterales bacterium]|nr:hypothetical protein [Solirubrobacterales bacterium]
MPTLEGPHADVLQEAVAEEARAQRALLDGDEATAAALFREAAATYRRSWELAPPRSFGRLVGMLKAAVIGGDAGEAASYARAQVAEADSATAGYVLAIAGLASGDDAGAAVAAEAMREGSPAFVRAADAIAALAARDADRYGAALRAIVEDFEGRDEHLTGVAIADTALMLERLAAARGMAAGLASPLLPSG